MKKYYFLIIVVLILGLVLTGCLLSNVGQVPPSEQSGITYLTKALLPHDDLVGLWHFSDNLTDSSGNNNHGTFSGVATYVDSPMGQALSFNGVDDYVSVDDSDTLDITNEITIEAWIKVAFHKNYNAIVIKGEDGAENYELLLYNSGRVHCPIKFEDGSRVWLNAEEAITDTEWHHVAMTYKPGEWRIYVDGVKRAERMDISKTPLTNDVPLFIGAEQYLGSFRPERFFNGLIDEVRIWKVALSECQLGSIIYDWTGFFRPVENLHTMNMVKAGRAIPVKFSLNGDQGLDIFATGYPKSIRIQCPLEGNFEPNELPTVEAGESSLSYDADQYIYVWKTEKDWAGTCRQLIVKLIDGTYHRANFTFK